MPLFFFVVLINVLVRIGAAAARKHCEPRAAPLCETCSFAHTPTIATDPRRGAWLWLALRARLREDGRKR